MWTFTSILCFRSALSDNLCSATCFNSEAYSYVLRQNNGESKRSATGVYSQRPHSFILNQQVPHDKNSSHCHHTLLIQRLQCARSISTNYWYRECNSTSTVLLPVAHAADRLTRCRCIVGIQFSDSNIMRNKGKGAVHTIDVSPVTTPQHMGPICCH